MFPSSMGPQRTPDTKVQVDSVGPSKVVVGLLSGFRWTPTVMKHYILEMGDLSPKKDKKSCTSSSDAKVLREETWRGQSQRLPIRQSKMDGTRAFEHGG